MWILDNEYIPPSTCFLDPVSLAVISIGSTVLSAGAGLVGSMQQASAASATAQYQSQVAKNNQTIADQNAAYARSVGQVEAQTQGMKTAALAGAATAGQGASGIDPTTGSPADVVQGIRTVGRADTNNIIANAELRARGYQIEASNQGASADLFASQAKTAQSAGLFSAGSSLLGGASSVGDKWLKFQREGVF
jgi:hypothetical protein